MCIKRLSVAACALVLVLGDPTVAGAQTAADFFDGETLQEVRLFINSRDLRTLRERFHENTHYPADLQWGNIRVRNVAVRSRGVGSRNPTKLALQVEFDRYTTGQRFFGLRTLVLDNNWLDPGMMRERVAMAFFGRMGMPAPRESFCRVYINNTYEGLYTCTEAVDTDFVARAYGDGSGYLFEYHFTTSFFAEFLGEDLDAYKPRFEPRSRQLEPDATLYTAIRDLFRAVNQTDDATWAQEVDRYLDLPQFMTRVAIENFLAENDGLLGGAGMANFYLYRDANSTRHRLVLWDKDSSFFDARFDIVKGEENVLFRRAFAVPALRALYLQVLGDCVRAAVADAWLESAIERAAAQIDAATREDTRRQFSNADFDAAIAFLREFARTRPTFVLQELAKRPTSP